MTKAEVLNRLNINQATLARYVCVTPSAVSQWRNNKVLPVLAQYRLERMFPGVFEAKDDELKKAIADARSTRKKAA